jgi:hypothetical protein
MDQIMHPAAFIAFDQILLDLGAASLVGNGADTNAIRALQAYFSAVRFRREQNAQVIRLANA